MSENIKSSESTTATKQKWVWKKLDGCELLKAAGVPYGAPATQRLIGQQDTNLTGPTAVSLEEVRYLVKEGIGLELITPEDGSEIERIAKEGGILGDIAAVFEKIAAAAKPFVPMDGLQFEVCNCSNPLPHGYYTRGQRKLASSGIMTLYDAFEEAERLLCAAEFLPQQAINLFAAAKNAGLSLDEAEHKQRYNALPAEVRERHQAKMSSAFDDLLGLTNPVRLQSKGQMPVI